MGKNRGKSEENGGRGTARVHVLNSAPMLLLFCSMQMQLGMYLHVFMAQNCRHSSGKLTQHECKFRAASLLPFQGPLPLSTPPFRPIDYLHGTPTHGNNCERPTRSWPRQCSNVLVRPACIFCGLPWPDGRWAMGGFGPEWAWHFGYHNALIAHAQHVVQWSGEKCL